MKNIINKIFAGFLVADMVLSPMTSFQVNAEDSSTTPTASPSSTAGSSASPVSTSSATAAAVSAEATPTASTVTTPLVVDVNGTYTVIASDAHVSYTPQIHLYANGIDTDKTAEVSVSEEKYLNAYAVSAASFKQVAATDDSGNKISYTIADASYAAEGSFVQFAFDAQGNIVKADAAGQYPADTFFVYVDRTSVSGTIHIENGIEDLSKVSITVSSSEEDAVYAGNSAAADVTMPSGSEDGTWSASGLLSTNPKTGKAIVYQAVMGSMDGYVITYDNTGTDHADLSDAAYDGGRINAAVDTSSSDTIAAISETVVSLKTNTQQVLRQAMFGAENAIRTYTVTNTVFNYASGDTAKYKLNADATVTIKDNAGKVISTGLIAANTDFSVPQGGTFSFATADSITATIDPDTTKSQIAIGNTSFTFSSTSDTSAEFKSQEPIENQNLSKLWLDGATAIASKPAITLALQYQVDGTATWLNVADNLSKLGYTAAPTIPEKNAESNVSEYVYSFSKTLNQYVVTGDDAGKTVTYRLTENPVPAGYAASYDEDTGKLVNTKLNPFSATVKWADANNGYSTREQIANWVASLTGRRTSLSSTDPAEVPLTTTDNTAEGYVQITDNGDGAWTVSMPNARAYDKNDFPNTYSLVEPATVAVDDGSTAEAGTSYEPVYKNNGNYASKSDGLYTGGTVTNTLTNTMSFTGTKKWADDNAAETIAARPSSSVTLYRYPLEAGNSYETASPVPGYTTTTLSNTATAPFTFILPTNDSATSHSLPMYNDDGYKYVYFVKESLSGGTNTYKQVFVNNGDITAADANKKFLFNNGELDNTITGTVDWQATKTWVAATRQDVDAKVTMSVYQYDPSTKQTIELTGKAQTLTGFGTEKKTDTAYFNGLPKYNADGLQYTYTVKETGLQTKVGTEFKDCTITTVQEGTSTVTYFLTADGYRYRQDTVTDNDKHTASVTNTLVGNAQVEINKTFPNGLLASPTTLTYTIYRNGTAIGTKTVSYTGDVDGQPFTPDAVTVASYEDLTTKVDAAATGLLPRYDASGIQYKYTVAETTIVSAATYGTTTNNSANEGTYTSAGTGYSLNEKYLQATANISNYKPGEGMSITVHKNWIDAGETLYHQDVHAALQYTADGTNWTTIGTGTIAKTTDYVYIGVPTEYQDLYKTWINNGMTETKAGDFRVVETALGANSEYTVVADGDASIAAFGGNSGHRSGYSFVATPNQNYDVSPVAAVNDSYDFTVTNRRVGVEKIKLTKTWVDGNNQKNTRPDSITFTVTASEAVFNGSTTKTFDVTAADGWALDTDWLQKYNYDTGAYISYSIEETSLNYANTNYAGLYQKAVSHLGDGLGYVVGEHHTGDIDTYSFKNSLSSSVVPSMNKYWMDLDTPEAIAKRPDIYPVLIRSYIDGSGITHTEQMTYQDRDWNLTEVNGNNHWWKCTFVAQPRYNSEGYEYTYYVAEKYSSAVLNDYFCSGAYEDMPDASGNYAETKTDGTAKTKVTVTVDGTTTALPAAKLDNDTNDAGTIVNRPQTERTVSGTKVWSNLPSGFKQQYLPDVTFSLWRYENDGTQAQANAVQVGTDANVNATLKSGSSVFAFAGTYPRYNDKGIPYVYIIKEISPTNVAYAYKVTNNTDAGLVVTNDFIQNQKYGITFTKSWPGVPAGTNVSTTLTLVRYLTDGSGNRIEGSRNTSFATAKDNAYSNVITANFTDAALYTQTSIYSKDYGWTNLAYYGPNGNPYVYYVEESSVPNGYKVYNAADGSAITAVSSVYTVKVTDNGYNTTTLSGSGTAGIKNTYGEILGSLNVAKAWNQESAYSVNPKPSTVTLKLWQWTDTTTAAPVEIGDNITLGPTTWSQAVSGLEIYSPTGEKYHYIVTEGADSTLSLSEATAAASAKKSSTAPAGYTVDSVTAPVDATAEGTNTVTVKNDLSLTTLNTTKIWKFNDGTDTTPEPTQLLFDANLNAVPTSITYHYQYSTDNTTWSVLNDASGNPVSKTITETNGTFSSAAMTDLPANNGTAAVSYRAYEYEIQYNDGRTKTRSTVPTGTDDPTTFDQISSTSSTATDTVANTTTTTNTNTLPVKKITITKTWDDEKNRDGKRTNVTFTVTRTNVNSLGDTATADVVLNYPTNTDQSSVTVYVPVKSNYNSSVDSTYSVAESTTGLNTEYTVKASATDGNYLVVENNKLDLGSTGTSAFFQNSKHRELITLNATKLWYYHGVYYNGTTGHNTVPDELQAYLTSATMNFTLQYRIDTGGTWTDVPANSAEFGNVTPTHTATINAATGAVSVDAWTNLPRHTADYSVKSYYYRIHETFDNGVSSNWEGSTSTIDGATVDATSKTDTITVSNTLNTTGLNVTKSWDDTNNTYQTRPDSITYEIQYSTDSTDGTDGTWTDVPLIWLKSNANYSTITEDRITVNSKAAYSVILTNLPKYTSDSKAYKYRAVEKVLTYGTTQVQPGTNAIYSISSDMHNFTTSTQAPNQTDTITNKLSVASLAATKTWVDQTNKFNMRPTSITFTVQSSKDNGTTWANYRPAGIDVTFTSTVSATDGSLTGGLSNLPRYDTTGTVIQYRAVELSFTYGDVTNTVYRSGNQIGDYTAAEGTTTYDAANGYSTALTNTLQTGSISISKAWVNTNQSLTQPTSAEFTLTAHTDKTTYTLPASVVNPVKLEAASWADSTSWKDLPLKDAYGDTITYTVTETTPAGYYASYQIGTTTTVKAAASITLSENTTTPIAYTNTMIPASISKEDQSGNKIAGAEFELTGSFADGSSSKTWTSTTDSSWNLTGLLTAGTIYTLTETTPAAGYTIAALIYLKADTTGTLYWDSSKTGNFNTAVGTNNALTVKDSQNEISITKTGASGNLAGTSFSLEGTFAAGTSPITWTTSATNPTNNPYTITGKLIAGNSYVLKETTPAPGYTKAADRYLKVDENGKLYQSSAGEDQTWTLVTNKALTVTDTQTTITLNKVNDAATPAALTGATFTVTGTFADNSTSLTMLSGAASQAVTGKFIVGNTYTFTESSSPALYKTMQPFAVKVNNDGTLTLIDTTRTDVTVSGSTITAKNISLHAGMTLSKLDDTDNSALTAGKTTFNLTGPASFNGGTAKQMTTDAAGKISISDLPKGDYTLTETATDGNYVNGSFTATFTVSDDCKDQTLTINSTNIGKTPFNLAVTTDAAHLKAGGLTNARQTGTVNVEKLGANGALTGVEFALYTDKDVQAGSSQKTDVNGKLKFSGLTWGSYYLKETAAPAGYILDTTHYAFTIGYDALTKNFTSAANAAITNTQNTFTLNKVNDAATPAALTGATFTVEGIFSDSPKSAVKTITAQSTTWAGLMIGGNSYTITETVPPAGYKAVAAFDVKMGTDGVLTSENLPAGVTIATGNIVTVADSQNSITVAKTDDQTPAKNLSGAEFTLTCMDGAKFADNQTSMSWTSAQDAQEIKGKLITGNTYKLSETSPAPGYLTAADVYLQLDSAGALWKCSTVDGTYEKVDGNLLLVQDTKNALQFTKKINGYETFYQPGADPTVYAGAKFGIYTDRECTNLYVPPTGDASTAISNAEGTVTFTGLAAGTYYVKEMSVLTTAELNTEVYTVTVSVNGSVSKLTASDGTEVDTVVNQPVKGTFEITKVDAVNNNKVLPGSTYQLFRSISDEDLQKKYQQGESNDMPKTVDTNEQYLIAEGTTDENGRIVFTGLLTGVGYVIREVVAPSGSQVSKDAIAFSLKTDNGTAVIDSFNDSDGTVTKNDKGEYLWQEPPTIVHVRKVDERGNLLAGAVLHIEDADGNIVVSSWISSSTDAKDITGVLEAGKRYRLVETAAPDGYVIASPVDFTVNEVTSGSTKEDLEKITQIVSMKDNRVDSVDTGDRTALNIWLSLFLSSIGAATAVLYFRRRTES